MANEIVKYGNEMNMVVFRKFTANEMNLFFSIVSRMRDKGNDTVTFSWEELRYLSKYKPTSTLRFVDDLNSTYGKMLELNYGSSYVKNNRLTISRFVLFTGFSITAGVSDDGSDIDTESGQVEITVNPKLHHILNELESWTRYSLEEFINLKSTYSKTMFRLLKQYRTTGKYVVKIDDFRELLDIPKSYQVGQIDQKVLAPIKEELSPIFKNLKITKNKSKRRGNKVLGFTFTFSPEDKNADDFTQGTKMSETNTPQPRKKKAVTKKEKLPEWAKEGYVPPKDEPLTPEQEAAFKERLEKYRARTAESRKKV